MAPTAVAVAGDGRVHVGTALGSIVELADDGAVVGVVVPPSLSAVTAVAVDRDGTVYWSSADGTVRRQIAGGAPEVLNAGLAPVSSLGLPAPPPAPPPAPAPTVGPAADPSTAPTTGTGTGRGVLARTGPDGNLSWLAAALLAAALAGARARPHRAERRSIGQPTSRE